jgi:hypothetical protein
MIKRFGEEKGRGHYCLYEFETNGPKEICFMLSSDRIQNAEWQEKQIIKLLKQMVKSKEIGGVDEFSTSMLMDAGGQYMEADEFLSEDNEEDVDEEDGDE